MPRWLRRDAPVDPDHMPSVGEDVRVYAIGDVHGRADLLDRLLDLIEQDEATRPPMALHLIFLGDLMDRGPRSAHVIVRAMALAQAGGHVHFLKGNHEEVFVLAARGDERAIPLFRRIGGIETLESYGLDGADAEAMDDAALADWMLANIPRDHVDFVDDFPDSHGIGDYLFVHAGIRPRVPIADQSPADLRWIRQEFLTHEGAHPKMVIHGHSITQDVDARANRIGIDTGAYHSGRLTAIGLQGTERWFLQTGD
ncbi:MAG: metallophosphoesterase [bacterium]|nr:metallophosphoesterase [bacterium]